jgi:hypothetical protein
MIPRTRIFRWFSFMTLSHSSFVWRLLRKLLLSGAVNILRGSEAGVYGDESSSSSCVLPKFSDQRNDTIGGSPHQERQHMRRADVTAAKILLTRKFRSIAQAARATGMKPHRLRRIGNGIHWLWDLDRSMIRVVVATAPTHLPTKIAFPCKLTCVCFLHCAGCIPVPSYRRAHRLASEEPDSRAWSWAPFHHSAVSAGDNSDS